MRSRIQRSAIVVVLTVVLATALSSFGVEAATSQEARPYRTVWDDFQAGFSATVTPGPAGARWFYFSAGPYVGDDGLTTTSTRGLKVVPKGTNPATGRPAFTRTLGQEPTNGGLPGGLDHVKWLAYANNIASTGVPGFDAVPGQDLACETRLSGRTFGTAEHPFGSRVRNPNDDLRLSGAAFNAIDFETFLVADFFVTNERIYALYERLPFGRPSSGGTLNEYASFTFTVPVGNRSIGDQHHLKIAYDRSRGIVRWLVDKQEVMRVDRLGYRIDRRHMILDHGGTETLVQPRQLACGLGMFTLLDASQPGQRGPGATADGLARLSAAPSFYFHTGQGQPTPQTFADPSSLPSSRLFGQGAELNARSLVVSSRRNDDDRRDADDLGDD
jgi:hypothetical protein